MSHLPPTGIRQEHFVALVERYTGLLRSAISRSLPPGLSVDVEDIEQEARLKVWKALTDGRVIDHPASYLYRIAVNAALDAARRVRSRREQALAIEDGDGVVAENEIDVQQLTRHASPEETALRTEVLDHVRSCLTTLLDNRRRAVGLHLQGFTTQEVGSLLGWSEAKARNLVYRGLKDLRECLRTRGIDYEME